LSGSCQSTLVLSSFFFFTDTPPTEIYTLSLHDALPIYVRDLMVGDGENFAGAAVEHFQAEFVLDHDPTLLAKEPVEMNRPGHVCDAVLREQQHLDGAALKKRNQVADDGVDLPKVAMNGGVDGPLRRLSSLRVCRTFQSGVSGSGKTA